MPNPLYIPNVLILTNLYVCTLIYVLQHVPINWLNPYGSKACIRFVIGSYWQASRSRAHLTPPACAFVHIPSRFSTMESIRNLDCWFTSKVRPTGTYETHGNNVQYTESRVFITMFCHTLGWTGSIGGRWATTQNWSKGYHAKIDWRLQIGSSDFLLQGQKLKDPITY